MNYAKEQEFSDADVFEDSPDEDAPVKRRTPKPRKPPKGDGQAVVMEQEEVDEGGVYRPTKPIYSEKGYDPNLPPIRERFPFLPEYEPDGSPRIELIVGRRPVDEKGDNEGSKSDDENLQISDEDEEDEDEEDEEVESGGRKRSKRGSKKSSSKKSQEPGVQSGPVEYEYLVKYKGRSYLHLEWKTGADLESMNKSAKTLYRRYLKKIASGQDEDLENPDFDPSYAEPQKIIDVAEQEITMELSDKELLEWEKEREKALAQECEDEMEIEGMDNGEEKKDQEEKTDQVEAKGDSSEAKGK